MSSSRTCLRPILAASRSSKGVSKCGSSARRQCTTSPTNHQRPTIPPHAPSPSGHSIRSLHTTPATLIARPILQKVQQQPPPPQMSAPPPGYRMNKITRPFVPVATHVRVPFPVNESLEVLDEMYIKLLGEGGDKALTEAVKWQCVTHKSFDHGLQPYNLKLTFFGRRIAYLHTTLSMIHQPIPQTAPPLEDAPLITNPSAEEELYNDPSLLLPSISKRNPLNRVSYISISNLLDSTNMFSLARSSGLINCLRWKPRNPSNLIDSGVQKVAEDAILAIVGAIALQKGGDAARRVMEERILVGLKTSGEVRKY
ncbi:hypothetical protein ABW19_dt0209410 [Dactylella cylindrospora]|nr:hypothetical protein ABW19_dt0209410 [Dactylella cylindrospora]